VGTSPLIFQLCIREGLAMGLFGFEIVKANKLKEVENLKGPPYLDPLYVKEWHFFLFFEVINHKTRSFEIGKSNIRYIGSFKF
jgi:hypothetical protein